MALDSGSPVSVLDDDTALGMGLEEAGKIRLNRSIPARLMRGRSFRAGPLVVRDPLYVVFDLDPFLDVAGMKDGVAGADGSVERVGGIIGYPLLRHAQVEIRYGEDVDRVFVHAPDTWSPPASISWTPMSLVESIASVEARLEGDRRARFHLDTGKSYNLSVSSHYVARHGLESGREKTRAENRRLEGVSEEWSTTLDWVELGGHRIERPAVAFRIPGTSAARQEGEIDGVVGRGLLKRFWIVFDYPRRRVAFIPRRSAAGS